MNKKLDARHKGMNEVYPLITFILLAYNQEKVIKEAVIGALNQTYSPMEIILSDDCSSDQTFQTMSNLVQNYKGDKHIILNRNKKNLGIGLHFDTIARKAKGKLLVAAAGDDISLPHRSSTIFEYHKNSNENILIFTSDFIKIGDDNKYLEQKSRSFSLNKRLSAESIINGNIKLRGALAAYDLRLINNFPRFNKNVTYEDRVLLFRAALLNGKVAKIPDNLVMIRDGGVTNIKGSIRMIRRITLERDITFLEQCTQDLNALNDLIEYKKILSMIQLNLNKSRIRLHFTLHPSGISAVIKLIVMKPSLALFGAKSLLRLSTWKKVLKKLNRK